MRREIYEQDGIAYFSRRTDSLPAMSLADPFVASVLSPEYPLVVVIHDEAGNQQQNLSEQQLAAPILAVLADPAKYSLNATSCLGVVVPHRAQRAALQSAIPALTVRDPATGLIPSVRSILSNAFKVVSAPSYSSARPKVIAITCAA